MMIIVGKNILETRSHDFIVNPCNTKGVAGKGLSKQIKDLYPNVYKDYVLACKIETLKIGIPSITYIHREKEKEILKPIGIIHFPTKEDWKNDSKYEYISSGLNFLAKNMPKEKIAFPALGCGNGNLSILIVYDIYISYINKFSIKNWDMFITKNQFEELTKSIGDKINARTVI